MNMYGKYLHVVRQIFGYFGHEKRIPHQWEQYNSQISHPELVNATAIIHNATLMGTVEVEENSRLKDAQLYGWCKIKIGRFSSLSGPNISLYSLHNPIVVGNFCSIARDVIFQEYNHMIDRCSSYFINQNVFNENFRKDTVSKGSIEIGNDVWVGAKSIILSGVKIGDGAVVGANSVVNSNIPPYAVAVGSPAKIVRYRFQEEIIDRLLALQWWNWPIETIYKNRTLFEEKLTLEKIGYIST